MKGIKECVSWMIDNGGKKIQHETLEMWFNGSSFVLKPRDIKEYEIDCFNMLDVNNWEPVPEPVDFMTAINSGKKINPVEYFEECHDEELRDKYESEKGFDLDGLWLWLESSVCNECQRDYINGKWIIKN